MQHRYSERWSWLSVVLAAATLAGCRPADPPAFRLDMTKAVAAQLPDDHQQAIADILDAMFGTPDEPFAMPETGLDIRKLRMAAGPAWNQHGGGKRGLYRLHCAHCHGISGDGLGPTAMILNPLPRDYRRGVYKFKSTCTAAEPTDDDLRVILQNGIPGTSMPSFALLPPDEIDALVEYVKYLSMRGQMETVLIDFVALEHDPEEPLDPIADAELRDIIVSDLLAEVVAGWQQADELVIVPDDETIPPDDRSPDKIAESVAKGRELFYGTRAACVQCHGPTGMGDGQQDDFDDWTKVHKEFKDATEAMESEIERLSGDLRGLSGDERRAVEQRLAALREEHRQRDRLAQALPPVRNAFPRNLRDGVYRGGRRPIDLYWRISAGIPGTPMPASGPAAPGAQGTLSEEEIWQIVDYVQSLPYEPASRPQAPQPVNLQAVN